MRISRQEINNMLDHDGSDNFNIRFEDSSGNQRIIDDLIIEDGQITLTESR